MITTDQMNYEDMKKAAANSVCGQCGGRLSVAWLNGAYVLRCHDLTHNTVSRHTEDNREKELRKEFSMYQSTALTKMSEQQMLDRISTAKFPQELTPGDKTLMARVAIAYGLDPLMKEISIFQGQPFVSIDGRYRKAQESGELDGVESRPATKQERLDWKIPESDFFFRSEVYRKGSAHAFVGWGRVRAAEVNPSGKFKPIDVNPQRMAEKRAEAQALRKAFNIPLPSAEMAGTPDQEEAATEIPIVDPETGEVKGQVIPPEKPKAKVSEPLKRLIDLMKKGDLEAEVKDYLLMAWEKRSLTELTEPEINTLIAAINDGKIKKA